MKKTYFTNIQSLKGIEDARDIPTEMVMAMRAREWMKDERTKTFHVNCKHSKSNAAAVRKAIKLMKHVEYFACVSQDFNWKNDAELIFYREIN